MLIHSTFKNDIQEKYKFLLERYIDSYKKNPDKKTGEFADLIHAEKKRLYELGIKQIEDNLFWETLACYYLYSSATFNICFIFNSDTVATGLMSFT